MNLYKKCIIIASSVILTCNSLLPLYISATESESVETQVPIGSSNTELNTEVPLTNDTDSQSNSDNNRPILDGTSVTVDPFFENFTSSTIINEYGQIINPNASTEIPDYVPGTLSPDITLNKSEYSNTPQYPDGWKTWKCGNSLWSDIMLDRSSVSTIGSPFMAIAKLLVQNNAIPNVWFSPTEYFNWVSKNNLVVGDSIVNGWDSLLKYQPDDYSDSKSYLLNDIKYVGSVIRGKESDNLLSSNSNSTKDKLENTSDAINVIDNYRKSGCAIILKLVNSNYVLVGNAITNNSKSDYEVYGSASTDKQYVSEYKDTDIIEILVFKGEKGLESSTNNLDKASSEEEEKNSGNSQSIYRLSNYTQTQKESLALVKNKYMTQNEVSAFKWNMIVSQFTIPYLQNINTTLENKAWKEMINNLNSVEYKLIGYDNSILKEGAKDYLTYLKSKTSEFKTVMEILQGENIYTPIYNSKGATATIEDMITGDVLYLKDNYAISSGDTSENAKSSETTTDVLDTSITTSETILLSEDVNSSASVTQDSASQSNSITSFKGLVDEFYGILNSDKKTVYESILNGASVQEIMIPCYINTDSTYMYNTLFLYNACRYSRVDNYVNIEGYYETVKDNLLYLDQYGNICIKSNPNGEYNDPNSYILVYPSYANPMYISTEISDTDIAGVYYDNYSNIMEKDSLTINGELKSVYTFRDGVKKTFKDLQPYLDVSNVTEDTYLGYYANTIKGSFQSNQLLDESGNPVSDYKFGRYNANGKDNLVYARIDTTSNFIGNLTILAMTKSVSDVNYSVKNNLISINSKYNNEINMIPYDGETKYDLNATAPNIFTSTDTTDEVLSNLTNLNISSDDDWEKLRIDENNNNTYVDANYEWYLSQNEYSKGLLGIDKYVESPVFTVLNNTSSNSLKINGNSISNGKFIIMKMKISAKNGYLSAMPSSSGFNGVTTVQNNKYSISGKSVEKKQLYPYLVQYEATKGNYLLPGLSDKIGEFKTGSISNLRSVISSVSSVADHNTTGVVMGENFWLMSMIDAEKYTTSFKLADSCTGNDKSGVGGSINSIFNNYNEPDKNPYLNTSIPHNFSNVAESQNSTNIFDWVIDDTAGWGFWTGTSDTIDTLRGSHLMESGITSKTTNDKIGLFSNVSLSTFYNTNSNNDQWYFLTNGSIVNPRYYSYDETDIINIAFIWDKYYINQSPLVTHMELKSIDGTKFYNDSSEGDKSSNEENTDSDSSSTDNNTTSVTSNTTDTSTVSDKGIVLTPYNLTNENNNNNLYYTKNSFISNQLISYNTYDGDTLITSEISASIPVYSVHYNVPLLMMCTYRNGYGDNLKRWVDDLKDEDSAAKYMMDLITQFTKKPITGIKNFTVGSIQYIHNNISKSGMGSIMNITNLTEFIIVKKFMIWYLIIQGIITTVLIIRVLLRNTINGGKFPYKKLMQALSFGFIPVIMLFSFNHAFSVLNRTLLEKPTAKVILTDLENMLNPTPKEIYGSDEDILVDDLVYDTEDTSNLAIKIQDSDGNYSQVTLEQLYNSIKYDGVVENKLINEKKYKLWYRSDKFVPVNYERYSNSIFYYFYDYLRYQYLGYCNVTGEMDTKAYDVDDITNISDYSNAINTAEDGYLKQKGKYIKMYTDMNYTTVNSGVSDILGLSNLFRFTDESGQLLSYYNADSNIESIFNDYKNRNASIVPETHDVFIWSLPYLYESNYFTKYKAMMYNTNNKIDNMSRWAFSPSSIPDDSGRVINRLYGSISQLKKDAPNSNPTNLEIKFNSINKNVYNKMFDLTSLYDDDVITDDVYIFVSALYATFEFNRTIGGNIEPTSLDLTTLSTDKLFKSIYSKEIKQAVADDNLLYMVYKSYGFLTSIIVFLSEMLLMLVMLVLSLAYLVIFVSVCLSCMLSDDLKLKDAFKRILSYLLIITVFQVVVDCIIIFTGDMINLVDNRISVGLMSLVVLIICLCIFLWVVRVFLGLLRNITSFGGDVVGDLVYGFVKNLNTQLYEIKKGVLTSCNIALHSPIHLTRNKEATNQSHSNSTKDMNIIELRRKININKMMKRK